MSTTDSRTGGGGDGSGSVHPALIAILRELPRSGTPWPQAKKELFMTAFRSIVDVIYPDQETQGLIDQKTQDLIKGLAGNKDYRPGSES